MAFQAIGSASQPLIGGLNRLLSFCKPDLLPTVFPTGFHPQTATARHELESALLRLEGQKKKWTALSRKDRAQLLKQCINTSISAAEKAAKAGEAVKGSYGTGVGEELLVWSSVVWGLREYAESLEADAQPPAFKTRQRDDGQLVVQLFPQRLDAIMFGNVKGELWIQPGKPATQGALYRDKQAGQPSDGAIALVLGAGNQVPVVCFDILHMLIAEDAVVICKMNPVNEYLGPYIRSAFQPLVDAGFLEIVYGGQPEGSFLCDHPKISIIHLTGSSRTYDSIVWGDLPKEEKRNPPCTKRVTAELGCVTPYIIVPGQWTQADLEYYASEIVAGLVNNNGHNCTKAEVIVTDAAWPQREAFLAALRKRLDDEPQRVAWYPGSADRLATAKKLIPGLQELGQPSEPGPAGAGTIQNGHHLEQRASTTYGPWLLSTGLTPDQASLQVENWVGVLQEVPLTGTDGSAASFLKTATQFANKRCWGSLSCSVFVPHTVQKEHPQTVEQAIADLQYGTVAINAPSFFAFAIPHMAWGAYPGNKPHDIGSGNCFVHNVQLYDHVQKSVLWVPWRLHPTHSYDTRNRNLPALAKAIMHYVGAPGIFTLVPAAMAALRG